MAFQNDIPIQQVLLYDSNGNPLAVQNGVAIPASTPAVLVGGSDGTNARYVAVDGSGRPVVVGAAASGASVTGAPVLIGGSDGANARTLSVDTAGELQVKSKAFGTVSAVNSTVAALNANATFTGSSEEVTNYAIAHVSVYASHASAVDGLSIEQSVDGTNWDFTAKFTVTAGVGTSFAVPCAARYFRVRYTNGGTTQTTFRLQTVFKGTYAKPNSHRLSDDITIDEEAELVAATLMARTPTGLFVPIEASEDRRLRVSSAVTPPANTTSINRFADGSINNNAIGEDVYTITNGKALRIQRFSGGGENSVAGGRVELAVRTGPVGSRVDTVIDVGYISGGNFQFDLEVDYVGDTSSGVNRQIVLKRINLGGSAMRIKGRWEGYEE